MHLVKVEHGAVTVRRNQALDDAEAVLCLGAVLQDTVFV